MSYDWFRNSSSANNGIQVPAIRLIVQGPDSPFTDMLVYEPYYQGSSTAAGLWQTASITSNSFFWWNKDAGARCAGGPDYTVSLGDWGDGHTTTANACSYSILDNAKVLGFSVGVGSGWNGMFDGAVDNVSFRLQDQNEATTYNFEVAGQSIVPEPSSYAMMLAGLAGLGFVARRRRTATGAQR